jgi:hypothetical protein
MKDNLYLLILLGLKVIIVPKKIFIFLFIKD